MQHLENPLRPVNVLMHYIENVNHGPNLAQTTEPLALSLAQPLSTATVTHIVPTLDSHAHTVIVRYRHRHTHIL